MSFSDLCSKLNKTYILIGTLFIFIVILLLLNYQKANKIYAPTEKFDSNIKTKNELVLYYAEWCGWSQKILPVWEELEKNNKLNVTLKKIECEKQPDEKCKSVQGYPTIIYYKDDKEIVFNGERTKENIITFLNKNA
jgi:thiol-disulfide isomerase/thioredoxin